MKDRIPLYPGRVKLNPVTGQENTYDMVRADEPTQEGTPLNKASLLKDATAVLYGQGVDAVPDDILSILSKAVLFVDGYLKDIGGSKVGPRIETGSYVGTGTYGPSNKNSLAFDFEPKIVALFGTNTAAYLNADASATSVMLLWGVTKILAVNGTSSVYFNSVEYAGNTMSWNADTQTGNEYIQLNASGVTYRYAAIG